MKKSKMETIIWNHITHNKIMIIPDNCQIIIGAEFNKFLMAKEMGFHLLHCDGGFLLAATFLWKKSIKWITFVDYIKFFDGNRYPLPREKIVIISEMIELDHIKLTAKEYKENEIEIGEIIFAPNTPETLTWKMGDSNILNVPDQCIINIPKEYNWIDELFLNYMRLNHYKYPNDDETALYIYWPITTIPFIGELDKKNKNFKVLQSPPPLHFRFLSGINRSVFPYKITDKNIKSINLSLEFFIYDDLRVIRKFRFFPHETVNN